jgi:hypothetical protein
MTAKRAFWEALAIVAAPILAIWGYYAYKAGLHWDEWPIYLIFAVIPAFLLLPLLYKRFFRGQGARAKFTRGQHIVWAAVTTVLATAYLLGALYAAPTGFDRASHIAFSLGWYLLAAEHVRRARKAEDNSPTTTQ